VIELNSGKKWTIDENVESVSEIRLKGFVLNV